MRVEGRTVEENDYSPPCLDIFKIKFVWIFLKLSKGKENN